MEKPIGVCRVALFGLIIDNIHIKFNLLSWALVYSIEYGKFKD